MNKDIRTIINEELSKSDVTSMINSKFSSELDSYDFKKKVKKLAAEVLKNWTKILWQRQSFWVGSIED